MRLRFALSHLLLSSLIFGGVTVLLFIVWFPAGYRELSGVVTLVLWMLAVDVVLGPGCTYVVANPRKSAKERARDIAIIVALQVAALIYGLFVAWSVRPAALVFEYSVFRIVSAAELDASVSVAHPESPRVNGVPLLSLRPFETPQEKLEMTLAAIAGYSLSARSELWRAYSLDSQPVIAQARPARELFMKAPSVEAELKRMTTLDVDDVGFLPVLGHHGVCRALAVSMQDAHVIGILGVDVCRP